MSEFQRKYKLASEQPLGKGRSSVCMECINLSDNSRFAVKIYKKKVECDNQIAVLKKAAAQPLSGVPRLVEVLTDSERTYVIMELIEGVNLLDYFSSIDLNGTTVYDAFYALWDLVESIHSLEFVHGRICFKNIYVLKNSKDYRLMGFSSAKPITDKHDKMIDYWAIGVCLYTVCCGHSPFDVLRCNLQVITKKIGNGDFDEKSDHWTTLADATKGFIKKLLCSSTSIYHSGEIKCIIKQSFQNSINNWKQLIDENEKIISIRADDADLPKMTLRMKERVDYTKKPNVQIPLPPKKSEKRRKPEVDKITKKYPKTTTRRNPELRVDELPKKCPKITKYTHATNISDDSMHAIYDWIFRPQQRPTDQLLTNYCFIRRDYK